MKYNRDYSVGAWCCLAAAFLALGWAHAEVKLPPVISDHMVLQRGVSAPIFGTAAEGESVTVVFRDRSVVAKADLHGHWQANVNPGEAGGPFDLTVKGANAILIKDVLVGEVWVGSGQSNMETPAGWIVYTNDTAMLANAAVAHPLLRLLPSAESKWVLATPETQRKFSALLFSFGVPLQKALQVPVGLMTGAVGGTPSGFWLSKAAYTGDADCQAVAAKALQAWNGEPAAQAEQAYRIALATWTQQVSAAKAAGKREPGKPSPPVAPGICPGMGHLYERWVRPLQPYAVRGVLWDQGESGTGIPGVDQYTLMGALIRSWRQDWGQGDFPFLYVQKPSGGGCAWDPADPVNWKAVVFLPLSPKLPAPSTSPANALDREMSIRIMHYTNTTMVASSDLAPGIHPVCKSGYGLRAARVALGKVYGQPVEYYGPLYQSHTVEGNKIRVCFTHVGQGLAACAAGKLQGFAVAGADQRFFWADAGIEGDTVVVSNAMVPAPVAVRYAFGSACANLFNKDGLPAAMFRTDAW